MSKNKEKLLNVIKKLHAQAESEKKLGNEEAAQTFFAKINQIVSDYNIDLMEALMSKDDKAEKEAIECYEKDKAILYYLPNEVKYGLWEIDLIDVIAKRNFCKALFNEYYHRDNEKEWLRSPRAIIYGTPTNVEIVKYLVNLAKSIFLPMAEVKYRERLNFVKNKFTFICNDSFTAKLKYQSMIGQSIMTPLLLAEEMGWGRGQLTKVMTLSKTIGNEHFVKCGTSEIGDVYMIKNPEKLGLISPKGMWIRSFLAGVVKGLDDKLKKDTYGVIEEQKIQNDGHSKLNEIILYNQSSLDEFINNQLGKKPQAMGNRTNNSDVNAQLNGYLQGKNTHLGKGINTGENISVTKMLK